MPHIKLPHDHGDHQEDFLKQVADLDNFKCLADVFKLLGDGNRLRIFWFLCHAEECVINISALVNMSSPAISHHLKQLRESGLIESRRVGKEVYYSASDSKESRMLHRVLEELMEISCQNNRKE